MKFQEAKIFSLNLISLVLVFGCSTGTLRVESAPESADVFVNVQGQAPRKVGQTPMNIIESTLAIGNEPFQITVQKEGYQSENILIPATSLSRATVIQMKLKENSNSNKAMNDQTLQRVASAVAQAQSLIKAKDYESAERSLTNVSSQFPGVSTLHELLGNVYYLRRDLQRALASYRRAYELNPSNPDTQRMIGKIEEIHRDKSNNGGGR